MKWSTTIPFNPIPKGRGRAFVSGGRVRVFTPKETRNAENNIKAHIISNNPIMFDGPVCVLLDFVFLRPKTVKRKDHTVKPDLTNLAKTVEDAANGVLWRDDAQIVTLFCRKSYGETALTRVTVWTSDEMNPDENMHAV